MRATLPVRGRSGGHVKTVFHKSEIEIQKKTAMNKRIIMFSMLRIAGKLPPADGEVANSLNLHGLRDQSFDHVLMPFEDLRISLSDIAQGSGSVILGNQCVI